LEAVRVASDKGTLSEKLREARREGKMWRNRAEWAEKRLLSLGGGETGMNVFKGVENGDYEGEE